MTERIIDEELKLIPYYRNDEASLPWYQDLDVCKQVDNRDEPYDLDLLHAMYDYLSSHGDCYYIEYKGTLVGGCFVKRQCRSRYCSVQRIPESAHWKTMR